jgi:hypothetical protein
MESSGDFGEICTADIDNFTDVDTLLQITSPFFRQQNCFKEISIEKYMFDEDLLEMNGYWKNLENEIGKNKFDLTKFVNNIETGIF